jgi:hypothetical protein
MEGTEEVSLPTLELTWPDSHDLLHPESDLVLRHGRPYTVSFARKWHGKRRLVRRLLARESSQQSLLTGVYVPSLYCLTGRQCQSTGSDTSGGKQIFWAVPDRPFDIGVGMEITEG